MVIRTSENPYRVAWITAALSLRLLARTVIRRRFVTAKLSTLAALDAELPRLLKKRKELKT